MVTIPEVVVLERERNKTKHDIDVKIVARTKLQIRRLQCDLLRCRVVRDECGQLIIPHLLSIWGSDWGIQIIVQET